MRTKLIYDFDLTKEEDRDEYERTKTAPEDVLNCKLFMWDFEQFIREIVKYRELTDPEYKLANEIRDKYFELKGEKNIKDLG